MGSSYSCQDVDRAETGDFVTDEKQYRFEACQPTHAAGHKVNIPAGVHTVERRSLSVRVHVGGREVDLTLAEFSRLQTEGKASEP